MIPVYDDARPWGVNICSALIERGVTARLFSHPDELGDVDRSAPVAFFPRHHPEDRDRHKEMARGLHASGFRLIPSISEIEHYDDKVAQMGVLRPFLPPTWLFRDPDDARVFADKAEFPLFSKATQGAGANNVRLLKDKADALREITLAFEGDGIRCIDRMKQKGYLYWQAAIETPFDWRVVMLGLDTALLVKRWNRPDRPMASNSGHIEMMNRWEPEHVSVVEYARKVCEAAKLTFTGLDIVPDGEGFRTLECSCAFGPIEKYAKGRFYRREAENTWQATDYTGRDFFALVADLIVEKRL